MDTTKQHLCPTCKRRFATKAALAQHTRDMHGKKPAAKRGSQRKAAKKSAPASVAMPSRIVVKGSRQASNGDMSRTSGSDILAVVSVPTMFQGSKVIAQISVNPATFEGTRLQSISMLWRRWRPVKLVFSVQTTLPTIAGGQLVMAWSADSSVKIPRELTNQMRYLTVFQPHKIFHGWETASISPTLPPSQKWFFLNSLEEEDSLYGTFILLMTGPPVMTGGNFQVTISLNWEIVFDTPALTGKQEADEIIEADDGYFPYFSTYSGHLPTGFTDRVTFQENVNGGYSSIVKFTQAFINTVYVPLKTGTIKYYSTATKQVDVPAMVRMKEVSDPFMWVFDSVAKAREYIKSGAAASISQYHAGGDWTSGNPPIKMEDDMEALYSNVTTPVKVDPPSIRTHDMQLTNKLVTAITKGFKSAVKAVNTNTSEAPGKSITQPAYVAGLCAVESASYETSYEDLNAADDDLCGAMSKLGAASLLP